MKVAVIIDTWFPFVGGGQVNALEISRELARMKVDVNIITRNNGRDELKKTKNLKIIKLGSKSDPNQNLPKIVFAIKAFFFLLSKDYDIIHVHAFFPGIVGYLLKIKNVNKNIWYIPNGINLELFDKVIAKKSNKPMVIFVGRLHPQKNLE